MKNQFYHLSPLARARTVARFGSDGRWYVFKTSSFGGFWQRALRDPSDLDVRDELRRSLRLRAHELDAVIGDLRATPLDPLAIGREAPVGGTPPATTVEILRELVRSNPRLGYSGWRTPTTSAEVHEENRNQLGLAAEEVSLCRRMFRDPRFRRAYAGRQNSYRLKHVAEGWDFDSAGRVAPPTLPFHNRYVADGSGIAAALLEGLTVDWDGRCPHCTVSVPKWDPSSQASS